MNDTERVRVRLDCWHYLEFSTAPPLLGDSVYCLRCQSMRVVKDAPTEYRIRCTKCPYARMLGSERLHAEITASKHHKRTGHAVALYNGRERVYVVGQVGARQYRDDKLF